MVLRVQDRLRVAGAYSKTGNEDGMAGLPFGESLRAFSVPRSYYIRALGDATEHYKHIKGIDTLKNDYGMEPASGTRGHNSKIVKSRSNE